MLHNLFNKVRKNTLPGKYYRNLYIGKNINPGLLTPGLTHFLDGLHDNHKEQYNLVLKKRKELHDSGKYEYRSDTQDIREGDWKASGIPDNLQRRHVELTGPANDPKMVINAMNSSANAYMLDLEDSMSPLWKNVLDGHSNILPAVSSWSPESANLLSATLTAVCEAVPASTCSLATLCILSLNAIILPKISLLSLPKPP